MHKNYDFLFHANNFNIHKSKYLHFFLKYLQHIDNYIIEYSIKIENEIIYPCRFNIWFKNNYSQNLYKSLKFIKQYESLDPSIKFDFSRFNKIINKNFNMEQISRFIVGIDFRDNILDSRIKLWFVDSNYNSYLAKINDHIDINKKIINFMYNPYLLFGFDFCFNGKNRLKIYPVLFKKDLKNKKISHNLQKYFSKSTYDLISLCDRFHIGLKEKYKIPTLHFHPEQKNKFITYMNNISYNKNFNNILDILKKRNMKEMFISLAEPEISNKKIENINFYYM